jgi:hypothetical protein
MNEMIHPTMGTYGNSRPGSYLCFGNEIGVDLAGAADARSGGNELIAVNALNVASI